MPTPEEERRRREQEALGAELYPTSNLGDPDPNTLLGPEEPNSSPLDPDTVPYDPTDLPPEPGHFGVHRYGMNMGGGLEQQFEDPDVVSIGERINRGVTAKGVAASGIAEINQRAHKLGLKVKGSPGPKARAAQEQVVGAGAAYQSRFGDSLGYASGYQVPAGGEPVAPDGAGLGPTYDELREQMDSGELRRRFQGDVASRTEQRVSEWGDDPEIAAAAAELDAKHNHGVKALLQNGLARKIRAEASLEGLKGVDAARVQALKDREDFLSEHAKKTLALQDKYDKDRSDLAAMRVNPDKFFEKSVGRKIGLGFALFVDGYLQAAQGINLGISDMVQKRIDRDVQTQRDNIELKWRDLKNTKLDRDYLDTQRVQGLAELKYLEATKYAAAASMMERTIAEKAIPLENSAKFNTEVANMKAASDKAVRDAQQLLFENGLKMSDRQIELAKIEAKRRGGGGGGGKAGKYGELDETNIAGSDTPPGYINFADWGITVEQGGEARGKVFIGDTSDRQKLAEEIRQQTNVDYESLRKLDLILRISKGRDIDMGSPERLLANQIMSSIMADILQKGGHAISEGDMVRINKGWQGSDGDMNKFFSTISGTELAMMLKRTRSNVENKLKYSMRGLGVGKVSLGKFDPIPMPEEFAPETGAEISTSPEVLQKLSGNIKSLENLDTLGSMVSASNTKWAGSPTEKIVVPNAIKFVEGELKKLSSDSFDDQEKRKKLKISLAKLQKALSVGKKKKKKPRSPTKTPELSSF